MRTVIDLLRQGNQELFHSAMISWLLDPQGEHGAGQQFLRAFADLVAERGRPELSQLLGDSSLEFVTTEHGVSGGRYDILLKVGGKLFAIENKTKSVGAHGQFEKYARAGALPIALGLSDVSFSEEVRSKYPLACYRDILAILDRMPTAANAFGVLLEQYRLFLRRELRIIELIRTCFEDPQAHTEGELAALLLEGEKAGYYSENDIRFLNHHYLEMLRRRLDITPELKGTAWDRNKNQQSGVWLASKPSRISFRAELENLLGREFSDFWFHIEIPRHVCVCSGSLTEAAAVIQLRGSAIGDKHHALTAFRKVHPSAEGERAVTTLRKSSHFLIAKDVSRQNLSVDEMAQQVIGFMSRFGTFLP